MDIVKLVTTLSASLKLDLSIDRLIHVGANTGQEVPIYEDAGISGYHLEANPAFFEELSAACAPTGKQTAVLACCDAEADQTVEFNVTSNKESSSLLPLGRHAVAYPTIDVVEKVQLKTTTLDHLAANGTLPSDPNFMVLDVQGAESRVLAGGQSLLGSPNLWGILSEVSLDALYEGGVAFDDLYQNHFKPHGFYLKSANFNRRGWANALFLRRWWRLDQHTPAPLEAIEKH